MNINIIEFKQLIKPNKLREECPINTNITKFVNKTRDEISKIIEGKSSKKLFIVGPCSIHNVEQAFEYSKMLKKIADKINDKILIVMRVYFEKPRTTIGWKGLINDPELNGSYDVNKGLRLARELLLKINSIGVPCGYEVLDTITPQYISDLISWGAIGARTTESQVHRQMVSGLSMPIGFKNGTSGDKIIAADAILSASFGHCFMGITDDGNPAICKTKGNKNCHVILRGGKDGPNFSPDHIQEMINILVERQQRPMIMVDCSHGNSKKNYKNQAGVLTRVMSYIDQYPNIIGVMIESNINKGKQCFKSVEDLEYGVSITDSCISIDKTYEILYDAYENL
jgi:3-deoxy-7-phosphoheptulonate synthase